MKNVMLILFAISFCLSCAWSQSFEINVREGKKLEKQIVKLTSLVSEDSFDGEYFKIVEGRSDNAIKFNHPDKMVILRAATTYYHLNVAREFMSKNYPQLGSKTESKIVIRVDQKEDYSDSNHFVIGSELVDTARTIPASIHRETKVVEYCQPLLNTETNQVEEICQTIENKPWDKEIWFFQAEILEIPSVYEEVAGYLDTRQFKNMMLGNFLFMSANQFMFYYFNGGELDDLFWESHLYSLALTLGITELFPKLVKLSSKLSKHKLFLETALIPEVIYHEYIHVALEKFITVGNSNHLIEGYANYFAYKISGLDKLAAKTKKLSKGFMPKSIKEKSLYSLDQEMAFWASHGSFTFSLLGKLEEVFGPEADSIFIKALDYLDGGSSLRYGFRAAIFKAIEDVGSHEGYLKNKALGAFRAKGL